MIAFQLVQTIYWVAVSTWFGGVLALALAVPVIFRVIRDANPILPDVLSVNLDNQHGSLLAGDLVGAIVRLLSNLQLICAGLVLLMLAGQWLVMDLTNQNKLHAILRSTFFLAAVGLACYDRYVVWPRAWRHRQAYVKNADDPDVANVEKEKMERYARESAALLSFTLVALSLMVIFSSVVTPRL